MLFRTIYSAVVAGILAGVALFALQSWTTLPLIHQAERYEKTDAASYPESRDIDVLETGYVRAVSTAVGDMLVAVGFGMLLAAIYALSGRDGLTAGLISGLAGFAMFYLGPAIVVPPSIPALKLAPLYLRQSAWLFAALCTGLGLAVLAIAPRGLRLAGIPLLVLPSVLFRYMFPLSRGAASSHALSAMERLFIVRALGDGLIFWLVLGAISGWAFKNSTAAARSLR